MAQSLTRREQNDTSRSRAREKRRQRHSRWGFTATRYVRPDDRDRREQHRGRPHLVERRADRGQRLARPGDVHRLEASQTTASAFTSSPARPSCTCAPGFHLPLSAGHERGHRDQQEREVDRGGAEDQDAADGGGVERQQQTGTGEQRGDHDPADRGAPPIDAAQETRAGQHTVAGYRVHRPRREPLRRDPAGDEGHEHERGERLGGPGAEGADHRGGDGSMSCPLTTARGSGWASTLARR